MNLNQDGINHGGNLASEWDFDGEVSFAVIFVVNFAQSERKRIETAIKTLKHPIGSFSRKKRVSRENHSYNKMGKKSVDFLNNYFATVLAFFHFFFFDRLLKYHNVVFRINTQTKRGWISLLRILGNLWKKSRIGSNINGEC